MFLLSVCVLPIEGLPAQEVHAVGTNLMFAQAPWHKPLLQPKLVFVAIPMSSTSRETVLPLVQELEKVRYKTPPYACTFKACWWWVCTWWLRKPHNDQVQLLQYAKQHAQPFVPTSFFMPAMQVAMHRDMAAVFDECKVDLQIELNINVENARIEHVRKCKHNLSAFCTIDPAVPESSSIDPAVPESSSSGQFQNPAPLAIIQFQNPAPLSSSIDPANHDQQLHESSSIENDQQIHEPSPKKSKTLKAVHITEKFCCSRRK